MDVRTGFWLIALSLVATLATAQPQDPTSHATAPRGAGARVAAASGWNELNAEQRLALQPLAGSWDKLSDIQKRKWLALSRNYGTMSAAEQSTLHSRMTEWAALSAKQRSVARLNFAKTRQLPPDEKRAKWEAYQALSPEEKRKLAASTGSKPTSAALAVKPVPAQKLAQVPQRKAVPGKNDAVPPSPGSTPTPQPPAAPPLAGHAP